MSSENQTVLLQEYNSCDTLIGRLDTLIWHTASVVFPITLAGFAYFGLSSTHTTEQFFAACAVAIGSISLLITWYLLSRQWYGYQAIAFYRMKEIEIELGLWHYHYSLFMRRPKRERESAIKAMNDEEKARFQKLEDHTGGFPRIGLRVAIKTITIIFLFGWVGLLLREYLATFKP
jgi:hypothetical protein